MNRLSGSAFLVVMMLFGGCATTSAPPSWVRGDSCHYPVAQYLTGVGQGDTPTVAAERARAALAAVFQVAITVVSRDHERYQSGPRRNARTSSATVAIDRRIETQTRQIVRGIRIARSWEDPKTVRYYALAVLPRLSAAVRLRAEIARMDAATAAYITEARASADLWRRIAAADQAVRIQKARAGVQRMLTVVDPTGVGVPARWRLSTLQISRDRLRRRVRIAPMVTEDPVGGLNAVLAAALSRAGLTVAPERTAPYRLVAALSVQYPPPAEGWDWARGVLQVELREAATGRTLGLRRWPLKVAALDMNTARQRLMSQVDRILTHDLGAVLTDVAGPGQGGGPAGGSAQRLAPDGH